MKAGSTEEKTTKGGRHARELLNAAYARLPAHEKQPTHPSAVCYNLLLKAPEDMLTVLVTCLRASYECGLPPAVGNAPAKSLIHAAFQVYCAQKEERGEGKRQEAGGRTQANFETWQETSELLTKMIMLLFEKAKEAYSNSTAAKGASQ